jgi:hypothetical protein
MAKSTLKGIEDKGAAKGAKAPPASKTDQAALEDETTESTALVEQPASKEKLTLTNEQLHESGLAGDFNQGDINLPRLNVVAKTSQLVDEGFTPGAIVLNKETSLVLKDQPLRVIVLNMLKQFQEDTEWGASDSLPRVFNSEDEVYAAGFSLEWGSPNLCRPMAHITMLVEAPEGLEAEDLDNFPYEFDGKNYAMAILTAAKSAYKTTAKEIATFAAFAGGAGVWTVAWSLTPKLRTEGDVSWFTPVMKRAGRLDDKLLEFVESVK